MEENKVSDEKKKQILKFMQLYEQEKKTNEWLREVYRNAIKYQENPNNFTIVGAGKDMMDVMVQLVVELPKIAEEFLPDDDVDEPMKDETIKSAESLILMNHWQTHIGEVKKLDQPKIDRMMESLDHVLQDVSKSVDLRTRLRKFMAGEITCPVLFDEEGNTYLAEKDFPKPQKTEVKEEIPARHKVLSEEELTATSKRHAAVQKTSPEHTLGEKKLQDPLLKKNKK